jgi:predicted nucleic acid-binding protein
MKTRLYLDNCSFNRPYDDLTFFKNYLEAEAKMFIQREIQLGIFELAWSFIMDYEVSRNPFPDRKNQISKWKDFAVVHVVKSENVMAMADSYMRQGIKLHDALHLACATKAGCACFITTDGKILKTPIESIRVANPIDFIRNLEAWQ